jgi:N-acyl amino acid synthase of PEP-CTERM/exosortase system
MMTMLAKRVFEAPHDVEAHEAEQLLDRFNRDFSCTIADEPGLLRQAFETRYRVYCIENAFEKPQENSHGIETDEFDDNSRHSVLIYRPTGETIGTVRLILPVDGQLGSFSMRNIVAHFGGRSPIPVSSTAEVSRFSISKRSRHEALGYPGNVRLLAESSRFAQRAEPLMSLGLIQGLVRMSAMEGITHWCAVMEPKMLRMLSAMGIHFTPVGALIEHHGLRQLCYCEVATVLKDVKLERPTFWQVITDDGMLDAA